MAIAFSNNGTDNVAVGTSSFTLATPSPVSVGDLKIAFINCYAGGAVTQTGGTGTWTAITDYGYIASPDSHISTFYKVHESSDTDPTFGWTGNNYAYGYIARVTGAKTTSPIGAKGTGSQGTTNPHTTTAITTTGVNSMAVLFDGAIGQTTLSTPSGWTSHFNQYDPTINTIILTTMYKTMTTSGSSTGTTSVNGQDGNWGSYQFEILAPSTSIIAPTLKVYIRR